MCIRDSGKHPVDHGTMCAYDAGIAAPKATYLDYAVLLSRTPGATAMAGLLSDAVLAYSKLRNEDASAGAQYRRRRHEEGARWLFVAVAWPTRGEEAGCFCLHALRRVR